MSQEEKKATGDSASAQQSTDEGFSSIFGSSIIAEPAADAQEEKSAAAPSAPPTESAVYQQKMNILQQQMQFKQQQQQQMIQYQQMIANMTPQQQQIMQAQMITMQHQQQQYQQAMLMKQQHQIQQQQKMQAKKKGNEATANKEAEAAPAKEDAKVDAKEEVDAGAEKPADASSSHAAGAAFGVPLNNPSQIQAANAQAQMFAAFNYQQQQQKYNNTISQLNQMNQFNQMNPLLFQQQMINQMQYRQPHYNPNQQNRFGNQNNQNRQKNQANQAQNNDSEKNDSNKQNSGAGQAAAEKYDENQLKQQLEFIKKLHQEQNGGDESLKNEDQKVQELQGKLQALVANLVDKIQKKHESLMISQQQLTMYQDTLKQKYNPIFTQMDEILQQKKYEYLDHLTRQLEANNERILLEKETLHKMEKSFNEIKPRFKNILEDQLQNIEKQIEKQKKMHEEAEQAQKEAESKKEEGKKGDEKKADEAAPADAGKSKEKAEKKEEGAADKKDADAKEPEEANENKDEKPAQEEQLKDQVDSDKIKAITAMVDEFNNIVAKNFSVYAQYDDFSFANSRSSDGIEEKLSVFFKEHFSGDFQLKNSFEPSVLPRIFYLEQRTKFIYSYKIMNYMTQAIMIQNKFNIADQTRYVITPKGHLFMIGGYNPQTREFLSESYVLDEYRSLFKLLNGMFYPRADHVVHQYKDNIYVLGGMAYRDDKNGGMPFVQSLNTCEFFSISSKKWIMLPNFEKPRQAFSVCQFNEKYIFILGGKCLKSEARIGDKLPFDYVQEVEAFDIEKNTWKTINYINDNYKLRIIHGGATQVTGKKIMIFGGLVDPAEDDEEAQTLTDNGQTVKLSNQSFYLDVVKGSVKRGPDLSTPSYYINNGGNLLCISNKLYAQGFGINHDLNKSALSALSATAADSKPQEKSAISESSRDASSTYHHKKILHCYNQVDQEFTEIHEGIFSAGSANRKQSMDLDD